jgi:hypothetical protein
LGGGAGLLTASSAPAPASFAFSFASGDQSYGCFQFLQLLSDLLPFSFGLVVLQIFLLLGFVLWSPWGENDGLARKRSSWKFVFGD